MPDPQDRPDSEPSDASTPPAKKLPGQEGRQESTSKKDAGEEGTRQKHPPRVLSPRHQSLPRRPSVCSSGSKPTASLQLLLRMQRHKQSRQWKAPTTPWRATHQCRRRVTRPCR